MKKKLLLLASFALMAGLSQVNAQSYCASGPTSDSYSNIDDVSITGDGTSSINYIPGCPGVIGVDDQTSLSVDVTGSQSYALDVTFGTCGGNYSGAGEIWIDYNQNGTFEASESIGQSSGTPGTAPWDAPVTFNFTVPATAFNGTTRMRVQQVEFGANPLDPCDNFSWGSTIDFSVNISGATPLTCPSPSDLSASNITGSSVDLSWTNGGTETMWNIEYGPTGFAQGSGTLVAANSNPFTLTGLNPTTGYDIYLQADCGGGDESLWIGPINVNTVIAAINCTSGANTNLYSTDFETSFPSDWSNTATGDPQWEYNTGTTGSFNTGPDGAFSGNGYIFLETTGGAQGDADTIYPNDPVDLTTALNEARMSFYYHMYGGDMGDLIVDVSDDGGATWTTEFTQVGQDQTAETDPWTPVEIDLSPYIGSMIEYRIIGVRGNGFGSDMAIDLFNIETCVSCPQPTDLVVNNIGATTADVDWQLGNTETEWAIEYGAPGFTPGTGNSMVTTNRPETISGLMSNTQYDVYVRAICGPGDTSVYSQSETFTTQCLVAAAPVIENFDDASTWVSGTGFANTDDTISSCWSRNPGPGNFFWGVRTGATGTGSTGPDDDVSGGGNYLYTEGSNGTTGDSAFVYSKRYDISNLTDPYVTFSYHMFGGDIDSLTVYASNDNGFSWDTIGRIYGQQQTASTDAWLDTSFSLSAYTNDTVAIGFLNTRGGLGSDVAIDEFSILPCNGDAGADGETDVCRLDTLTNLNDVVSINQELGGRWEFPLDQSLVVDDTMLSVLLLPTDSYEAYYIVPGACQEDTAVATINVFPASSAGENGTVEVCLNEPVNLIEGLNGNVDLGGDWYDPSNNVLASGQIAAPSADGNYNYTYITSNGVCPADTALVDLDVDGDCDYLSLGTEAMKEISIYPNPATSEVNIVNPANTEALKVEILDVNGRVVAVDDKALENTTEGTVAIDHLETGIYTIRIYNESGQKTFKLVKQ
ncbi:MAG: GEVED domain-containing protein [Bacteroidota bacterium]